MAQIREIRLIDDLDGSKADETVRFTIDNATYEIDLSADNAANLRKGLADYIDHARKVNSRQGRKTAARPSSDRERNASIREWARENGHVIAERGRIPQEIMIRFNAAR